MTSATSHEPSRAGGQGDSILTVYDRQLAGLRERHPHWRIWYVPRSADGSVTWCAQPQPTLNEDSPEHLAEAIAEVEDNTVA